MKGVISGACEINSTAAKRDNIWLFVNRPAREVNVDFRAIPKEHVTKWKVAVQKDATGERASTAI